MRLKTGACRVGLILRTSKCCECDGGDAAALLQRTASYFTDKLIPVLLRHADVADNHVRHDSIIQKLQSLSGTCGGRHASVAACEYIRNKFTCIRFIVHHQHAYSQERE